MKNINGLIQYSKDNNELTKNALKESLIKLLHKIDFDSITVSKLCHVAGVSRMSFYRNYSIIHDIFKEIAIDFNVDVIKIAGPPFKDGTNIEWYIKTFSYIRSKKDDYLIMRQKKFQEEWMRVVNNLATNEKNISKEKYYQRLMWCGGFENVASIWVSNGMKESVEEISKYCINYLPHLINN